MADRRPRRDRGDDDRWRRPDPSDRRPGPGPRSDKRPFQPRRDRPFEPRADQPKRPQGGGERAPLRRGGDGPPDRRRDQDRPWRRPPSFPGPDERQRDPGDRPDRPRPGHRHETRDRADRPPRPPGRRFGPSPDRRFGPPPNRAPRPLIAQPAGELVGDGEELVAGRHPVQEAFTARRDAVRLLVVPERRAALDNLVIHATTLRIPVVEVEGGTLTSLANFDGHQGIALVVRRRPPATLDDVLALAHGRGQPPFVLVLDSLEDPQNLGTLIRSAEACGVHGVIYPARRAAPLTPAAIKASAGATEHVLLAPVEDLAGALVDLRARGLRAVGADQDAALSYAEADLRGPLALVVGSEGFGISGQLRRRLDQSVRIPMHGRIASLNAAVAGSVLLFAAATQRPSAQPGGQAEAREQAPQATVAGAEPAASDAAPEPESAVEADLLPDDTSPT